MRSAFDELLTGDYQKAKIALIDCIKSGHTNKARVRQFLEEEVSDNNKNKVLAELVARGEADILEAVVKKGIFKDSHIYEALDPDEEEYYYNGISLIKTCAACMSKSDLSEEYKARYNKIYQLLINSCGVILLPLKNSTLDGYKALFDSLSNADENSMACNLRILGKTNPDRQRTDYNNENFIRTTTDNLGRNKNCKIVLEFVDFIILKAWMKDEAMASLVSRLALKAKEHNNHELVNSLLDHYKGNGIMHQALIKALNPPAKAVENPTAGISEPTVKKEQQISLPPSLSAGLAGVLATLAVGEVVINKLLPASISDAPFIIKALGCVAGTAGAKYIFEFTYNHPKIGIILSALSFVASWCLDKESVKNNPAIIHFYVATIAVSGFAAYLQNDRDAIVKR